MTITGEQQLLALDLGQLKVIELMLSYDMYGVNTALRTGKGLNQGPGSLMDNASYSSKQAFHQDAVAVFASLASSLAINGQVQLYRGIRHVNAPHNLAATMQTVVTSGSVPPQPVTDPGYGFAVTDPATAIRYTSTQPHTPSTPVLLQLTANRGLCIPKPEHRTNKLVEKICNADVGILETGIGQVIFPANTKWRVTNVDLSKTQHNMPVVHMTQI